MDWEVWRVVSSPRFTVSLREIEQEWSLEDLWDANRVLDAFEKAERMTNRPR